MHHTPTCPPHAHAAFYTVIENGKMLENTLGDDPQAEFTMTVGYDDFAKTSKGELDANAAFMQGRLKVTGNMGKLMTLMPLTQSPEYKAIAEKVNAQTEY
jgi:putative sterol carrier protein